MIVQPARECAHLPCTCEVPIDQTYCSDDCSMKAAHGGEHVDCDCGHADCGRDLSLSEEEAPRAA
jgi:hypothetical protein